MTRSLVVLVYTVAGVAYLLWRLFYTLSDAPLVWSLPFLGAEVFLFATGLAFYLLLPERDADTPVARGPVDGVVDVLIPTFAESVNLVRLTVIAAQQMRGNTRVHLLDDGDRPEMAALAKTLDVHYRTRPTHQHFKAGNLNAALAGTSAEFVLVLDADHLPRPNFLERTLANFVEPSVAFVQVPQRYYNTDSFQHPTAGRRWHESTVFHERLQVGASRKGATILVGTGCILRRSALAEVGGFAVDSVTEDVSTSMKLHSRGYEGRYVCEPIAFLTAPDSTLAWCGQRLRWAQGAMQIVRRSNPLWMPNLTLWQRLAYSSALASFASGWATLFLHIAPGLYLLTGIAPVSVDATVMLPVVLAHLGVDMATHHWLAWPDSRWFATERYRAVQIPIQVRAAFRLFLPEGARFLPTPKGAHTGLPGSVVAGLAGLLAFHVAAVGCGSWMVLNEMGHPPAIVFATAVALWFAVVTASALKHVLRRRGALGQSAITVSMPVVMALDGDTQDAMVVRASPDRLHLSVSRSIPQGAAVQVTGVGAGVVERGGHSAVVRLKWDDDEARMAFAEWVYLRDPDVPLNLRIPPHSP
ncbi:MAG: cellulose synthase/poly-beta-1,6-N-acetylglucosamine synthase-like glycosyltransferase [bacterium]|jgi:cellulose synthase/poly-beta-1,6-N-acetylglucosamine synthase-like glycosyltransferase